MILPTYVGIVIRIPNKQPGFNGNYFFSWRTCFVGRRFVSFDRSVFNWLDTFWVHDLDIPGTSCLFLGGWKDPFQHHDDYSAYIISCCPRDLLYQSMDSLWIFSTLVSQIQSNLNMIDSRYVQYLSFCLSIYISIRPSISICVYLCIMHTPFLLTKSTSYLQIYESHFICDRSIFPFIHPLFVCTCLSIDPCMHLSKATYPIVDLYFCRFVYLYIIVWMSPM